MPQTARQAEHTYRGRKIRDHDNARDRAIPFWQVHCQDPAHNLELHPVFFQTGLSPDAYAANGWLMRCPACSKRKKRKQESAGRKLWKRRRYHDKKWERWGRLDVNLQRRGAD